MGCNCGKKRQTVVSVSQAKAAAAGKADTEKDRGARKGK